MGDLLVKTLVVLMGIAALAYLVLYAGRRLGLGRPAGPMALVGRLPLDHRRMLYLVRVGGRVFVVGASEAGLSTLGELPEHELDLSNTLEEPAPSAFVRALQRAKRDANPNSRIDGDGA
jgi:flagellar protein FliO/FliZ